MAFSLAVLRGQASLDKDPRLLLVLRSFHPCKNVHMIVLDSLFGREMILDQRGADSLDRARAPASNASG